MAEIYNYTTPTNVPTLTADLEEEFGSNLLSVVDTIGGTSVALSVALSVDDKDNLDMFIADHEADMNDFLFSDYLERSSHFHNEDDKQWMPYDFDYTIHMNKGLFKDVAYVTTPTNQNEAKSQPMSAVHFWDYDGANYSIPLFKRTFEFVRDEISLASERTEIFHAMRRDGAWIEYKRIHKYLTKAEQITEAERRRGQIIADMKVNTIGLLMMTEGISEAESASLGRPFLTQNKLHIIDYIDDASDGFLNAIAGASSVTYPWLDNTSVAIGGATIRQFMIGSL